MLLELFKVFFRIGAFTFGGGYAMLPLIEDEIVNSKEWLRREEFLDMIAVAQSLPGAIAVNTSIMVGYRRFGVKGALSALAGMVLPSFLIIVFLAGAVIKYQDHPALIKGFRAVRPVVAALIFSAVFRLRKGVNWNGFSYVVFGASALGLIVLGINPIWVVIGAGLTGILFHKGVQSWS